MKYRVDKDSAGAEMKPGAASSVLFTLYDCVRKFSRHARPAAVTKSEE